MELLLRLLDIIWVVTSDEDLVIPPSTRPGWSITVDSLERGWKVDCCIGNRFDEPDIFASSATDDMVEGVLEFQQVDGSF